MVNLPMHVLLATFTVSAFIKLCLDLQAYLHVQWLRFQHVSAYSRCTATARILHAYCTARIPHSQTMDFGLWPAQAVRSSAHCRCHTYQDTKTGLWQAPDAGLARVEQRKHKRAQGYHGVHACHLFWYMVATICVHMTNALWPPICECKTEHGRATRHSR